MPFAQHHYPFENKENFGELFPADFISEGIDQSFPCFQKDNDVVQKASIQSQTNDGYYDA